MLERLDLFFYKLRNFTYCLLVIAGLLLAAALISGTSKELVQAENGEAPVSLLSVDGTDNYNVVASSMASAAAGLEKFAGSMEDAVSNSFGAVTSAAGQIDNLATGSGRFIGRSLKSGTVFAVRGIGSGFAFVGETASRGLAFMIHAPINILGFVTDSAAARAVIRPSDRAVVPIIEAPSIFASERGAVLPAVEAASHTAPPPDTEAIWPIHGAVTTEFGVPHWPYQPTHTGLDISDGRRAGATPVKPFKPGRVIKTVYSYRGFGNHVIVDHGAGMTSLYGHLASISVQEGQEVDKTTTLGSQGSTGASTGTHLHFEIRINGRPVNPLQYVSGRP